MKWSYGVTTVPQREGSLLPRTLQSLAQAGFDNPRVFVDRGLGAFGNWFLALHELLIREPESDLYALFQDDVLACSFLREYVSRCPYPTNGYLNLITYPYNELAFSLGERGWRLATGSGKGAQGLVFSRDALVALISERGFVERSLNTQDSPLGGKLKRGQRNIDGGVVEAMRRAGYKEYVHFPSLLDHTGTESAIGNLPQPAIGCFLGESYDPRDLLDKK